MTLITDFGQLIDQYRIEKKIGEKTFTDCYLAFDVEGNSPISLEILRQSYVGDLSIVSQFMNRSLALTQIRHPNLAHVIKLGNSADNLPYIVNEYIEGYPLTERLKQLDRQQAPAHSIYALKIVQQITSALILAERHGILHYELTPDHILLKNVTLKSDDSVVVIDMAAPLIGESVTADSRSNQAAFLSPEQLDGKKLDGRSHIFSLGAILYTLLAGELTPSEPVSFRSKTLRQAAGGKTPLELNRDNLAAETYVLVDTCLQRNPARRYRDLIQFSEALSAALAAEEKHVYLIQEPKPARRPWPLILPILILIGMCIGFGFMAASNLPTVALGTPAEAMSTGETSSQNPTIDTPTTTATTIPTEVSTVSEIAIVAQPESTTTATPSPIHTAPPTPTATDTAVATATITPTPWPSYRITSSSASIRTGPGVVYPTIGFVYSGDVIRILAKSDHIPPWFIIETDTGIIGWVSAAVGEAETIYNLEDIELAATIPAAPTSTPTPTNTPLPTDTPNNSGSGGGSGGSTPEPPRPTPTPPL